MKTMNIIGICKRLRVALQHSALAVAAIAGIAISTAKAATATQTFNLGTSPASTNFPTTGVSSLVVKIAKGSLPPGSILRSVTATNLKLETELGNSWASDLGVFIDPTPETPGGDGLLKIGDDNVYGGSANSQGWGGGQNDGPFTGSRTDANWTPAIDLHDAAVMFGNGWAGNTAYSGTITIEYDSLPAAILSFGPGATVDSLVANAANINWTVPYGTDVTTLAPTFTLSTGTCDKDNGGPTTYDFTSPVVYTVTDGPTVNTYTVTVNVTPISTQKDILTFGPGAVITGTNIAWTVPFGTDVTMLAPTYTVSAFASGSPTSGATVDFTSPQTYTITAQDSSTQDYTVTVTVAPDETTVIWDIAGSGTWNTGTPNWLGQISGLPTTYSNGDNVIFNKTNGGTITVDAGITPLTTTVSAASGTYIFGGEPIAGGSLTKSGGGTLQFTVPNTYAGDTLLEGGLTRISVLVQGALGAGTITLNGGNLQLERQDISNPVIVGASGGTISGGNSFPDTLQNAVTLNGILTINSGGTGSHRISGNITGTGGITKIGGPYGNGSGMILSGTNDYTGPTTIDSGKAQITQPAALPNGDLIINTGGELNLSYTGTATIASLRLGGVYMPSGVYGSSNSPAANQRNTFFPPQGPFGGYNCTGTVTVVDTSARALITSFGSNIPGSTAVISPVVANAGTIAFTVPFGTDLATLAPAFVLWTGATSDQTSEVLPVPGFDMGSVVYTVTSSDLATVNTYTVTATVAPANSQKDILTFGPGAVITGTDIAWTVPFGTDVTTLMPSYTVSPFAAGSPSSGASVDFTLPQTYTITAQDASAQDYTVTVTVTPASSQKDILTFGPGAVITGTNIAWSVPYGTDVTTLTPSYTVSPLASGSPSSGASVDFTSPQTYTITAQDSSTQDYTVTVTVLPPVASVTFNLGTSPAGTTVGAGVGGLSPLIIKGVLPASSTLRKVSTNMKLEASVAGDTWTSDSLLYFDSDPLSPGTAVTMQIGGDYNGAMGTVSQYVGWNGGDDGVGTVINEMKEAGVNWVGDIDLNDVQFSLGNNYAQSTLSGSITVEYQGVGNDIVSFGLPGNPGVITLAPGSNTITLYVAGDVSALAPDFIMSNGATCTADGNPVTSGVTAVDFTNPVLYTVTASDGISTNDYTVTIIGGYAGWAALYAGGVGAAPGDDFNTDCVENGVAYFMGENGIANNPGIVAGSVTWPYLNPVTSYKVQTSTDLTPGGWTDVLPGDPRLTDTGLGGSVSYNLLPNALDSLYVRLLVTP